MLHPSTKKLIDKLSEMTRKQRVAWVEGEDSTIVLDTEGYRVILEPAPHQVILTDPLGREIETCSPEDFEGESDAQGRPYAQFVAELYREASRYARGTEKAIRTLLAGLDGADASGPDTSADLPAPDALADDTVADEDEQAMRSAVATMADEVNDPAPAEAGDSFVAPPAEVEPEARPMPEAWEPEDTVTPAAGASAAAAEPDEIAAAPAEPEPQTATEPVAAEQPAEPPSPRISLSGIPFGMRYGAAPDWPVASQAEPSAAEPPPAAEAPERGLADAMPEGSAPAADEPATAAPVEAALAPALPDPEPQPEAPPPPRIVIDGTADLPDIPFEPAGAESAARSGSVSYEEEDESSADPPAAPRPFNPWN